ncbi:pentapeptide repeat-containing protein [Actinomadura gamaensis]|uniref:Pentapeptide repeat-containing protein n=1 Tax=Actinomadura gamaensis TaxID=1763541 RepID=A0ABV9U7A0_9ACTN
MAPQEPSSAPFAVIGGPAAGTVPWPRCRAVFGCSGRAVEPFRGCPAHLRPGERALFVGRLRPGADLDLRGVTVPADLLSDVLDALTGPDRRPHLGRTRLDGAVLPSAAALRGACFEGDSSFDGAAFVGGASFFDARFLGNVSFRGARFGGNASFHQARFHRHAAFTETVFAGDALFGEASWLADADFTRAVFIGAAAFDRARFGRDAGMQAACFGGALSCRRVRVGRNARFDRARFRHGLWLGPLAAGERLVLTDVSAHGGVQVQAAAVRIEADGLTARGDTDLRVRGAEVDLSNAVCSGRLRVRAQARPFCGLPESADTELPVRVLSLGGVGAPRVELTDVDLSHCRFLGLAHPDGLRVRGDCAFATRPGRRWRGGRRAVLSEDSAAETPSRLAALYRQLARATADADGGTARDFRYRALELRRRSEPDQWHRWALHLLWITCGYGLRAGRTIAWVAVLAGLLAGGAALADQTHRHSAAHPHRTDHSRGTERHGGTVGQPGPGLVRRVPPRTTGMTAPPSGTVHRANGRFADRL